MCFQCNTFSVMIEDRMTIWSPTQTLVMLPSRITDSPSFRASFWLPERLGSDVSRKRMDYFSFSTPNRMRSLCRWEKIDLLLRSMQQLSLKGTYRNCQFDSELLRQPVSFLINSTGPLWETLYMLWTICRCPKFCYSLRNGVHTTGAAVIYIWIADIWRNHTTLHWRSGMMTLMCNKLVSLDFKINWMEATLCRLFLPRAGKIFL